MLADISVSSEKSFSSDAANQDQEVVILLSLLLVFSHKKYIYIYFEKSFLIAHMHCGKFEEVLYGTFTCLFSAKGSETLFLR